MRKNLTYFITLSTFLLLTCSCSGQTNDLAEQAPILHTEFESTSEIVEVSRKTSESVLETSDDLVHSTTLTEDTTTSEEFVTITSTTKHHDTSAESTSSIVDSWLTTILDSKNTTTDNLQTTPIEETTTTKPEITTTTSDADTITSTTTVEVHASTPKTTYITTSIHQTDNTTTTTASTTSSTGITTSTNPTTSTNSTTSSVAQTPEGLMLERTNYFRTINNVNKLSSSTTLNELAMFRAKELAESFGHVRPDGGKVQDLLNSYDIRYTIAEENIALAPIDDVAMEAAVDYWMDTVGYKDNILNEELTDIGIGIFEHDNMYYFVQIFTN